MITNLNLKKYHMKYLKYLFLGFFFGLLLGCGEDNSGSGSKGFLGNTFLAGDENLRHDEILEDSDKDKALKEAAEYKRWKGFSVVVIDSCEYLIRTYSDRKHIGHHGYGFGYGYMAHKGNCRFCRERNEKK